MALEEVVLAKVPQGGLVGVVRVEPGPVEAVEAGAPGLDWRLVGRLTPRPGAGPLCWNLAEAGALELSEGWDRATLRERAPRVPIGVEGRVGPALLTHR